MRKTRFAGLLGRFLPDVVRQDLFEPALQDLYAESARTGRGTGLATIGLFLECWRLAPSEVFAMFSHDLRHALRLLVREPGFTTAAILTLALGIGANVAVFAIVNAVLLRPLPYPDADRLLVLQHRDRRTGITKEFIAMGDFVDLRARQRSFESLAAFGAGPSTIYALHDPFDMFVLYATPDLLDTLRTRASLGRPLGTDDAREGAAPVMMLGYDVWRQRFSGDPSVVGRSVKMGESIRQVVGIAAPGFRFPANSRIDAIVPMSIPGEPPAQRKSGWTFAVGRLAADASPDRALGDLMAISRQMEQEHPDQNQGSEYFALSVRDAMVGDTKPALLLLLAAVALVMLIAGVNVANLLVARAVGRRQEMAVRVALGAGRSRLVAQWLTESLVLATVGGSVGILLAIWTIPMVVRMIPASVSLPELATIGVDRVVLAFTAGLALVTTIVFGIAPALGNRVDHAAGALVNPGRVTAAASARRASSTLVVIETALAILLLTGAGLVLRSFSRLLALNPEFQIERVLTLDIALPPDRYREEPARSAFYARAFDVLQRLKGIESVGSAIVMPLTGNNWTGPFDRADHPVPARQRPPDVGWQAATGGYFRTLGIPLRVGRLFNDGDRPKGTPVVIISDAVRERFFPGEDPIGKKVRSDDGDAEIVGVVGNIRRAALTDQPRADMYFPLERSPQRETTLVFRIEGDPLKSVPVIREALRGLEPEIVIRDIQTLDAIARESIQTTRLALSLLGIFALAALALAAVGIYGVMAHSVRQRTREIGTRVAVGASASNIVWLVMREGVLVAGLGAVVGLATGVATARSLSALPYGTSPADPLTLAASALVLLIVALLACYIPARRATRIDSVRTLGAQ
jgi:putative ABC transport system permease protein